MSVVYGSNAHHMIEALFKSAAHALKEAVQQTNGASLSTKGTL
jgi:imidazoleglycerol-phosphate dehydratase